MKHKILIVFLAIFSVSAFADVKFPKASGYVNDFAGILNSEEKRYLAELAQKTEKDTTAEIAVVTVSTVKPLSIEEYSVRLFSEWGIGKKGKDNGVLLLVAKNDREVKIETGYGLEGVLPDGLCGEIIRNYIIPEFKNGNYGAGIIAGVNEISAIIGGGHYKQAAPGNAGDLEKLVKDKIQSIVYIILVIVILAAMFIPRIGYRSTWHSGYWGGSGGGFGGFGGGGFGGFGGGRSGGGGAVGRW